MADRDRSNSATVVSAPKLSFAWACALGLLAGWVAAGSCGAITTSLQALVVWGLLILVGLLIRPQISVRATAAALVVLLLTPRLLGANPFLLPLGVVGVLGLLAASRQGVQRRILYAASTAVLALTLLRLAQLQIPIVWIVCDTIGRQLGNLSHLLRRGDVFVPHELL